MEYLRSLGRLKEIWVSRLQTSQESKTSQKSIWRQGKEYFGKMTTIQRPVSIQGVEVNWDIMPKPPIADATKWL
jgi:hypothetical protein